MMPTAAPPTSDSDPVVPETIAGEPPIVRTRPQVFKVFTRSSRFNEAPLNEESPKGGTARTRLPSVRGDSGVQMNESVRLNNAGVAEQRPLAIPVRENAHVMAALLDIVDGVGTYPPNYLYDLD